MLENNQNNQDSSQNTLNDDFNVELSDEIWGSKSAEKSSASSAAADSLWGDLETGDIWDDIEASVTDLEATLGVKPKDTDAPTVQGVGGLDLAGKLAELDAAGTGEADKNASEAAAKSGESHDADGFDFDIGEDGLDIDIGETAFSGVSVTDEDSKTDDSEKQSADAQSEDSVEEEGDIRYAVTMIPGVSGGLKAIDPDDLNGATAGDNEGNLERTPSGNLRVKGEISNSRIDVQAIVDEESGEESKNDSKGSAASKEVRRLIKMENGEEPDEEEDVPASEKSAVADSEDDEDDDSQLTERARMGRVIPEGEVETSEHTMGHDVHYSESECAPNPSKSNLIRVLLAVAVILLALVIFAAFWVKHEIEVKPVAYIQQGAFQFDNGQFQHLYFSSARNHIAMCSDYRGVVLSGGKLVSEFWPGVGGCTRVRLSDDGTTVWFLDRDNELYEVNLTTAVGFNAKRVKELVGIRGTEFAVGKNEVVFFALSSKGEVLRHINTQSGLVKEDDIPEDALPCEGFTADKYGYVSGDAIHLFDHGVESVASLDADKLGCSRKSALSCAMDDTGDWTVLCKDSIRQGKGKQALEPVHYDNTALRSGAASYRMIRHSEGTELVFTDTWVRLDNRNNISTIELKQPLNKNFEVAYHTDENMPLIGLSNGIVKFSPDGQVSSAHAKPTGIIAGTLFIGDGSQAVIIESDYTTGKSRGSRWDLLEGRMIADGSFDGVVEKVNISDHGHYGFLINELTGHIVWTNWMTAAVLGELTPRLPVADAVWSSDEKYVLLYYIDDSADMFVRDEDQMKLLRSYDSNVVVGFASNELLWRIDDGRVFNERISDGAFSVINERLTDQLAEEGIRHIYAHPYSDDVMFWGENGIWRYNTASRRLNLISSDNIAWLIPDRSGNYVVTSSGMIDLSTLEIKPLEKIGGGHLALRWIGSSQYLQSDDGQYVYDWQIKRIQKVVPDVTRMRFIGSNGGEHPSRNVVLSIRDKIITLEQLMPDSGPRTVSAFGGFTMNSWCWISSNGAIQANGDVCTSFQKGPDGKSTLVANNASVANSMKPVLSGPSHSAFAPAVVDFIDKVKLHIETVPENAFIVFAASEGELPSELSFEDGVVPAPFDAEVGLDSRWFGLVVAADGYESRTLLFRPDREELSLRIPLLPVDAASTFNIQWSEPPEDDDAANGEQAPADAQNAPVADAQDGADNAPAADGDTVVDDTVIENAAVSDDLDIEMKAVVMGHIPAITACLKKQPRPRHLLLSLQDDQLSIADPTLNDNMRNCLTPIVDDIAAKHKDGALPELSDFACLNIDIQLVK